MVQMDILICTKQPKLLPQDTFSGLKIYGKRSLQPGPFPVLAGGAYRAPPDLIPGLRKYTPWQGCKERKKDEGKK